MKMHNVQNHKFFTHHFIQKIPKQKEEIKEMFLLSKRMNMKQQQ